MASSGPQNLKNHARIHPIFHYFIMPVFFITFVGSVINAILHPGIHSGWMVVLSAALIALAFVARINALRVQDRVIRLEERLRLSTLLSEPVRSRIGELSLSQLIALRFASDAEIPGLVEQTFAAGMDGKRIKQAIREWRADDLRV